MYQYSAMKLSAKQALEPHQELLGQALKLDRGLVQGREQGLVNHDEVVNLGLEPAQQRVLLVSQEKEVLKRDPREVVVQVEIARKL